MRTDAYLFGKLFARNGPMCPWVFWPKLGHKPIPESAVGKENRIIEDKSLLLSVIFIPGFGLCSFQSFTKKGQWSWLLFLVEPGLKILSSYLLKKGWLY